MITATVWFQSGRLMPISGGKQLTMQIVVSVTMNTKCSCWLAFQTLLVVFYIPFILKYSILTYRCVVTVFLTVDYTDELLSQDIHSDSSDLDLDFDFSSDECSEFAAESPELQGT